MGKVLLVLGILAIAGGAAYLWWGDNGSFRISFLDSLPRKDIMSVASSGTVTSDTRSVSEFLQDTGKNITSWLGDTTHSFVSSVFDTAKSEITDTAKEVAQDTLESVGEQLGLSNFTSNDFVIRYVTRTGTQTLFTVQNTLGTIATGTISYSIVWGDGSQESETAAPVQASYIFSHIWNMAGEYDVEFHFVYNKKESTSNVRIQVEE